MEESFTPTTDSSSMLDYLSDKFYNVSSIDTLDDVFEGNNYFITNSDIQRSKSMKNLAKLKLEESLTTINNASLNNLYSGNKNYMETLNLPSTATQVDVTIEHSEPKKSIDDHFYKRPSHCNKILAKSTASTSDAPAPENTYKIKSSYSRSNKIIKDLQYNIKYIQGNFSSGSTILFEDEEFIRTDVDVNSDKFKYSNECWYNDKSENKINDQNTSANRKFDSTKLSQLINMDETTNYREFNEVNEAVFIDMILNKAHIENDHEVKWRKSPIFKITNSNFESELYPDFDTRRSPFSADNLAMSHKNAEILNSTVGSGGHPSIDEMTKLSVIKEENKIDGESRRSLTTLDPSYLTVGMTCDLSPARMSAESASEANSLTGTSGFLSGLHIRQGSCGKSSNLSFESGCLSINPGTR